MQQNQKHSAQGSGDSKTRYIPSVLRQSVRQTQTDRQMDGQKNRRGKETDRQTDMGEWTNRQTLIDKQIDGSIKQTDGEKRDRQVGTDRQRRGRQCGKMETRERTKERRENYQ